MICDMRIACHFLRDHLYLRRRRQREKVLGDKTNSLSLRHLHCMQSVRRNFAIFMRISLMFFSVYQRNF